MKLNNLFNTLLLMLIFTNITNSMDLETGRENEIGSKETTEKTNAKDIAKKMKAIYLAKKESAAFEDRIPSKIALWHLKKIKWVNWTKEEIAVAYKLFNYDKVDGEVFIRVLIYLDRYSARDNVDKLELLTLLNELPDEDKANVGRLSAILFHCLAVNVIKLI